MKVLMNAGPWLPVPPHGYGGIENVVATLVPELRRLGVYRHSHDDTLRGRLGLHRPTNRYAEAR